MNHSINRKLNRQLFFWISVILLLLPFVQISFPPSTDLPQHLCQIHLLSEIIQGKTALYEIHWYPPNTLVYFILAIVGRLFPPPLSGKIVLMILVLAWIGSFYLLAYYRNRPVENAMFAGLLIFNISFYWGFLSFLVGWPFFIFWLILSLQPMNKKNLTCMFIISIFLYWAHVLWFLVSSAWLLLYNIYRFKNFKSFIYNLLPVIPIGIITLIWRSSFLLAYQRTGIDLKPYWSNSPFERLNPYFFINTLTGIKGLFEIIIVFAIFAWIMISLYSNWKSLKKKTDIPLIIGALFFLFISFFAPLKYLNTIFFAQRWFPCAIILLILGLPSPGMNKKLIRAVSIILLIFYSTITSATWVMFERTELSGLKRSLNMIPENQRVLGLDFIKTSNFIKWRPFVQTFAYSQAIKGGELNFSFAEQPSGIVQYKERRKTQWTRGLKWFPEMIQDKDLEYFDYILINTKEENHLLFAATPNLKSVTFQGRWRLYKIIHE